MYTLYIIHYTLTNLSRENVIKAEYPDFNWNAGLPSTGPGEGGLAEALSPIGCYRSGNYFHLGRGECAAKRGGRGRGERGGNGKGWKRKKAQQPEVYHWETMQLATA